MRIVSMENPWEPTMVAGDNGVAEILWSDNEWKNKKKNKRRVLLYRAGEKKSVDFQFGKNKNEKKNRNAHLCPFPLNA